MITKTIEATYAESTLHLEEALDLAPQSRVRVRIEIPPPPGVSSELVAELDEAFADSPDPEERALQEHMSRLRRKQSEEW